MCLQYGIWAYSASGHAKYDQYAEAFYKRARQYIQADEMRVSRLLPHVCAMFSKFVILERRRTFCYSKSRSSMGYHCQL